MEVYDLMVKNGIPTARHVVVHRKEEVKEVDGTSSWILSAPTTTFVEEEDHIEVDGVRLSKPFVEKPFDADDHNVYIYYPRYSFSSLSFLSLSPLLLFCFFFVWN